MEKMEITIHSSPEKQPLIRPMLSMLQSIPKVDNNGFNNNNTFSKVKRVIDTLRLLTTSDFMNTVVPTTVFGVCMASSQLLTTGQHSANCYNLLPTIAITLFWNWINIVLFSLSNQRLPDAIEEDALNKPWRPIPAGLLSPLTARRALALGIPVVVGISFLMGVGVEALMLVCFTWLYNDLAGGDEHWVFRNLIVTVGVAVYNHGSVRVAGIFMSTDAQAVMPTQMGYVWLFSIGLLWFTTIAVSDLRDVEGDKKRNRSTMILAFGSEISRYIIATFVLIWTILLPLLLQLEPTSYSTISSVINALYVVYRLLAAKGDHGTMKAWALWLMTVYALPVSCSA